MAPPAESALSANPIGIQKEERTQGPGLGIINNHTAIISVRLTGKGKQVPTLALVVRLWLG